MFEGVTVCAPFEHDGVVTTKMTQNFGSTLPTGWGQLSDEENERNWAIFRDRFGFTPGIDARSWPAIAEPIPSVVFDLGAAPAATPGAWAARVDAINAEALRCFVTDWNDDPNFVVLDWQHPGYTFDAEAHAAAKELAEWRVPVYPNGDYYIFSRDDFTEGTFGHPWERTLCVFGERMVEGLGRTLSAWLPRLRVNGEQVDSQVG